MQNEVVIVGTTPANGANRVEASALAEAASEAKTAPEAPASQPSPQAEQAEIANDPFKDLLAMEQRLRAKVMALMAEQKPEALSCLQEAVFQTQILEEDFKRAEAERTDAEKFLEEAGKLLAAAGEAEVNCRDARARGAMQLQKHVRAIIALGILTDEEVRNLGVNLPGQAPVSVSDRAEADKAPAASKPAAQTVSSEDIAKVWEARRGERFGRDETPRGSRDGGREGGRRRLQVSDEERAIEQAMTEGIKTLGADEDASARWSAFGEQRGNDEAPRLCFFGQAGKPGALTLAYYDEVGIARRLSKKSPEKFFFSYVGLTEEGLGDIREYLAGLGKMDFKELAQRKSKLWYEINDLEDEGGGRVTEEEGPRYSLLLLKLMAVKHAMSKPRR